MKRLIMITGMSICVVRCSGTPTAPRESTSSGVPGLPNYYAITGQVTDIGGHPIDGALVYNCGGNSAYEVDSTGRYQIGWDLKPGQTYTLQAFKQNHTPGMAFETTGYLDYLIVTKSLRWDGKTAPVLDFQLQQCTRPGTAMCGAFVPHPCQQ
jgi:hypothetical protein